MNNNLPIFQFSMQMLVDELEDLDYEISFSGHCTYEQNIQFCSAYWGQEKNGDRTVFIVEASYAKDFSEKMSDTCCVVLDKETDITNCCVIKISSEVSSIKVLSDITIIIQKYSKWYNSILRIINQDFDLNRLCSATIDILQNPVYIHDENFDILAMPMWVVGMIRWIVDDRTGNITIPLEDIKRKQLSKAYQCTMHLHGAQLWDPPDSSHRSIYVNIWNGNTYRGRLLIVEMNKPLNHTHFEIAQYLGKILEFAIDSGRFLNQNSNTFELTISSIISGERIQRERLEQQLKSIGWEPNQEYVCVRFKPVLSNQTIMTNRKIAYSIRRYLDKSYSCSTQNGVFTVVNVTQANYSINDIADKVTDICDTTNTEAGISNQFFDFFAMPDAFKQAEEAISLGNKINEKKIKVHVFQTYLFDYLARKISEDYPYCLMSLPEIRKLYLSDREHETEYIATLKAYLDNNCKIGEAADTLFIHRSTLSYRLEQIQKISNIDLTNPEDRLIIGLYIRLASRYENKEL